MENVLRGEPTGDRDASAADLRMSLISPLCVDADTAVRSVSHLE